MLCDKAGILVYHYNYVHAGPLRTTTPTPPSARGLLQSIDQLPRADGNILKLTANSLIAYTARELTHRVASGTRASTSSSVHASHSAVGVRHSRTPSSIRDPARACA